MSAPYRLRASGPTSVASADGILGPHVRTFRGAAHSKSIFAVTPFVLLLAYVVWLFHQGQLGHWFNSGFSALAVTILFVLAIALIGYTAAVGGGELVRVHADGLLDLRAGPRAVRWDEVQSITAVPAPDGSGVVRHLLRTTDGAVLSLGRSIANVEELVDEIRVRLVEQRTPSLKVRIADGDTLRFGAVTASREGIRVGDSVLEWDAVEEVEAEGGEIVLRGHGGKRLGAAPLGDVPNAFLLAELAHRRG
ncbi:MAG TPA: DUF6585 family protein [Polyangiaceae bacterium]